MTDIEGIDFLVKFMLSYALATIVFAIVFVGLTLVAMWCLFKRMDIAPWKCLIPIYGMYVFIQRVWGGYAPIAYVVIVAVSLFLAPIGAALMMVFNVILAVNTTKAFATPMWYVLLLVFVPVLGYGLIVLKHYEYIGSDYAICKF